LLIVALIPLTFHENIFKVVFDGISGKLSDFEFVEDAFTVILNFSKVACLGLEILEISDFAFKFDSSVFWGFALFLLKFFSVSLSSLILGFL